MITIGLDVLIWDFVFLIIGISIGVFIGSTWR